MNEDSPSLANNAARPTSPRLITAFPLNARHLPQLKIKFQSKLNQPRIIDARVNQPKRSGRTCEVCIRQSKLSVVEEVEKLSSKVHSHALPVGQDEMFDRREISVYEIRAVDWRPTCISQFARSGPHKALGVEPLS